MNPETCFSICQTKNELITTRNRLFIATANRNRQADKQTSFSRPYGAHRYLLTSQPTASQWTKICRPFGTLNHTKLN